jgi:nicotinate-nucleotide adenylyltransferase
MRVGIFGGTFDPIHNGHLRVAEEVRESFSLERIYFVPVFIPPHKKDQQISGMEDRLNMIRLALKGNYLFKLSDIEAKRGGVSYSIDTISSMEAKFGELYYLIGVDAFSEIHTWHRYTDLFYHTNFVVMVRPSHKGKPGLRMFPSHVRKQIKALDDATFEHVSGKRVHLQAVTQLDISATKIRYSTSEGKSIRYLVPPQVEKYIKGKELYKCGMGNEKARMMNVQQGM